MFVFVISDDSWLGLGHDWRSLTYGSGGTQGDKKWLKVTIFDGHKKIWCYVRSVVSQVHLVGSVTSRVQYILFGRGDITQKKMLRWVVWLAGASRGVMQVYHVCGLATVSRALQNRQVSETQQDFTPPMETWRVNKYQKKTVQVSTKQVNNRGKNSLFL